MAGALAAALLLSLLAAPAGAAEADDSGDVQETASDADDAQPDGKSANDPWEPFNRSVFAFNETLDRYALEPVATGWHFVMPERVEHSLSNFFDHLLLPTRFANDVLQLKPWLAYETLWRAVVNTTVGLGGFFDPASAWQIYKSDEDFGQTLGRWGTPPGPYLVLPLLGPSSPRDTVGLAVDSVAYVPPYFLPFWATASGRAVDIVNRRAKVLETLREERKAAFDWYAAVRSAYTQYRENRVRDRADEPDDPNEASDDEDLYGSDEDFE